MTKPSLRIEVQHGEGAVEFFGGLVVCFGGLELIGKRTNIYSFVVAGQLYPPFFEALVPVHSPETIFSVSIFLIAGILSNGSYSEVGFSIVEAVTIYMVNDETIGGGENLAVH